MKTFNKVLHSENIPARKIGREWKFSRRALIDWVGDGPLHGLLPGIRTRRTSPATPGVSSRESLCSFEKSKTAAGLPAGSIELD